MKILIVGCGFLGEAAADFFSEAGHEVLGVVRSRESAEALCGGAFQVVATDIAENPALPSGWIQPDWLIHCASTGGGGLETYRKVYFEGLDNMVRLTSPRRTLFVSSTSVYGQTDGEWVDEDSTTEPAVETGRILLQAEALIPHACVLRLSGLYGPGRSMVLGKFRDGSACLEEGGGRWINQVHRDDAARALLHAVTQNLTGIFNVTDDRPATQKEVYSWIAHHFGAPLPPEGPANPHRPRGASNKRISNKRLKATGWAPVFSDYRAALAAL